MISQKYITELDFKNINDIFNYIIDSEINGAYLQFKELINKLSINQFKDFLNYLTYNNYGNAENTEIFKNKVLNVRL